MTCPKCDYFPMHREVQHSEMGSIVVYECYNCGYVKW